MDAAPSTLPIGRSGRLEALGVEGPDGDHAVLVRQASEARALLIGAPAQGDRERLVVTPLDDDVEVRVDGDALAIWLGSAPITPTAGSQAVPGWASGIGLALLLAIVGLAVLGSFTFFGWLLRSIGL